MTNKEKFIEVFGFTPRFCPAPESVCVVNATRCVGCPFNHFWEKEYKEQKEEG